MDASQKNSRLLWHNKGINNNNLFLNTSIYDVFPTILRMTSGPVFFEMSDSGFVPGAEN